MKPYLLLHKNWLSFMRLGSCCMLLCLLFGQLAVAQSATVANPLAIGQNCSGGTPNFKAFSYDSVAKKLTQIGANCTPNLQSPGFNPGGGSIAFSPKDQKVFYIETTTGNNSIVWSWTPGVCPSSSQAPIYTYASTFIVGLEFNAQTGDGYQLEFSTGSAPYNIYLRKVTSFGPPLVAGAPQQIMLPAGKNIYQQNGDIVITPTGKMYFILDNKMFYLDYSTYGSGTLNASYIDTLKNGTGNNVIGLSYANGNFIASVQGSTCSYKQIDISSGVANVKPVTLATGTFTSYDMATMLTGIGAAKKVYYIQQLAANSYSVQYDIKVKNFGNVNLTNVQVTDSVKKIFGTAFVNASVSAVGTLPSGLTINPLFNGNTVCTIFSALGTMKTAPADSATVRVTVSLSSPNVNTTYLNSAIATATGAIFSNNVRDSSMNSAVLDADPSRTDVPDLAGQGVPTPFTLATWVLLPSKIVDFNARLNGAAADLRWEIFNQDAATTIYVQRSADGINFQNLTEIQRQGESEHSIYTWRDNNPLTGTNIYRLLVKSPTSNNLYSDLVVVRTKDRSSAVTISPNPFSQQFNFTIELEKADKITYSIFNVGSQPVRKGQYSGHEGLNTVGVSELESLPPGSYVLEVTAGGQQYFKKMLKN